MPDEPPPEPYAYIGCALCIVAMGLAIALVLWVISMIEKGT